MLKILCYYDLKKVCKLGEGLNPSLLRIGVKKLLAEEIIYSFTPTRNLLNRKGNI